MSQIQWNKFIGQERIKNVLSSAFVNNTLGHAYLLCGDAGTGKFAAAFELAMALLCKSPDKKPCGRCDSCTRMLKYGHPDFHVVLPVAPETEHKKKDGALNDEGWKFISECVIRRIQNPYHLRTYSAIPSIPIDWVKEVNQSILRGALEGERSVAIIDGIDMLSDDSANAMLKTLEEPPKGTLILLLTDKIHALLPTILSRCQILRFAWLSPQEISSELGTMSGGSPSDKRIQDVSYCGSLGRAIHMFENPGADVINDAIRFWTLCERGIWNDVFELCDHLVKLDDYGLYEKFFKETLELVRNAFFAKLRGTENYIRGNSSSEITFHTHDGLEKVEDLMEICEKALNQIAHRANISLVFANFAISLMEILNVEKQQHC
jgi:DNA polymerase-3 subunit delta'